MKNILFLIALICAMHIHAQERFDDIGRISIHAYVPESEELPYESHKLLETKLSQIRLFQPMASLITRISLDLF